MKATVPALWTLLFLGLYKTSASLLFVSPTSPNPTPPYSSWTTAATRIQDAVDAAPPGASVVVTNGVYAGGLVVGKPLFLMSVNGAQFTIVDGGGTNRCLYMTNSVWVGGFTFTNGYADTGAGVLVTDTNGYSMLTNCVITGNSAGTGGGVYGATAYSCVLTSNTARGNGSGGGAAYSSLFNCLLTGNSAPGNSSGGAAYSTLYNCTVSGNSAAQAGGVFQSTLYNCIVYDNTAASEPNYSSSTLNYCCTIPMPASGVGNITNAPLFVNEAAFDFRLRAGSPCIDAGNNAYAGSTVDLAGYPRFAGAAVDMGAYEYSAPVITTQPASQTVYAGTNVTFTVAASGASALQWQWWFNHLAIRNATNSALILSAVTTNDAGSYSVVITNNSGAVTSQVAILTVIEAKPSITVQPVSQTVLAGSTVSFTSEAVGSLPLSWLWQYNGTAIPAATGPTLALPSVTTNQAGSYSVVITNPVGSVTSQVAVLTVLASSPPGPKYVWQNSPSPTLPYTNWATAAHSIQDAVDVGLAGDTILVTNGAYPGGLVVGKPLSVEGVNGPQFTVIDGGGTNGCVAMTNGASLVGLTLTNGSAGSGGGAMTYYPGTGFLTNCVLAGNNANGYGGTGGGALSCTLYNCTLTGNGNEGMTNGSAAANCTLYNCYITGNLGAGGAAAYFCNLYGCALTDNSVGGAVSSTLYNCTVAGNGFGVASSALYNCVVYYNQKTYGSPGYYGLSFNYYGSTLNYCCTTPMPTNGVGNITNEPALVTDWRLSSTSPCTGAGSTAYAQGVDLDGEPWRNPPAIGCDEYYTGSLTGALKVASTASWSAVPTGFEVIFDGTITGRASDSRWEFGDGTVESNRLHTSHQWLAPGDYNVVLRAYNLDNPAGVTAVLPVRVAAQPPILYVDANSSNPVAPYANWSSAAKNIQDALAAVSVPRSLVLVTNGTYAGVIIVSNSVTLMSVNGPTVTVIDGGGTNQCISLITNVNLSGFTITNGSSGGVSCSSAYSINTTAYLTNCIIAGNLGSGVFGGTLYNCVLSNNSNYFAGSGANSATLYNCTISGNSASYNGTAAWLCTLYNCEITGNAGSEAAAGCVLHNCALTGNSGDGAANACTLYNCTLAANGNHGASGSTLYNCIAYYNSSSGGRNYDNGCTLNYCCTTPMPTNGVGNITNEPALAGSWRLSADSPCRGRGNPNYASGVDLDGEPWLNPPSIGCDEFYSQSATGALSLVIVAAWTNVAPGFNVALDGQILGNASAIRWEFGDGTIESNRLFTSHQWALPGNYTVVLRAYNNDNPSGITAQVLVRVASTFTYYVDINSTNPSPPYSDWSVAATNIQDAVAAAVVPGSLVLVTNGVYQFGGAAANRVDVEVPVTVRSVNGPTATVIQGYQVPGTTNGDSAVRCVYLCDGAILSGFTLTNGATRLADNSALSWSGGGVYCQSSASVVTNCTLVGNSAYLVGGGAVGGTFRNCALIGNSALNQAGGGAYAAILEHCTLSGNTSSFHGGGAYRCTLYNCTLTGNQAPAGGAVSGSTLYNCTLADNSAGFGGGASSDDFGVPSMLYNCIVYFNTATNGPNFYYSILNNCCTTPMPTNGVSNITNDPLFVSQAGGDFHLQTNSPCINAGNNTFVYSATDLDGNPRIVSGTVDIGAYEYQGKGSIISYAWLQQYGLPTNGSVDSSDPDGDGMNNWQEWICGTNPTNALSVLRLLSARSTSTNVTVSWQSVAGINYFLECTAGLAAGQTPTNFVVIATNILGQTGTTSFTDTNAAGPGSSFYRVAVQGP